MLRDRRATAFLAMTGNKFHHGMSVGGVTDGVGVFDGVGVILGNGVSDGV